VGAPGQRCPQALVLPAKPYPVTTLRAGAAGPAAPSAPSQAGARLSAGHGGGGQQPTGLSFAIAEYSVVSGHLLRWQLQQLEERGHELVWCFGYFFIFNWF